MTNNESPSTENAADDRPRAWRPADLSFARVSSRTAGDWLRWMVADGVLRKLRGIKVGRPSRVYAWIENGGPNRRGRGAR